MNLIIVESPHKAGVIQGFLGKSEYKVVSSKGHIRDLEEKDMSVDIAHNFEPKYVVSPDKKALVAELRKLAAGADMVWLASDPDREGEAIAWHLSETLGLDPARTRRITYNEVTKSAVLNALANPRDIDMNLVDAQQARRVLDRLVGFELSPVLWRKIQRGLSAGRVQSVALRLVVDREKEIMAFKPEAYYKTDTTFTAHDGSKACATLDTRFSSLEAAREFLEQSIGARYTVHSVDKKEGTRCPAPPFTTSTMQQEAGRKLHFSAGSTMRIAQSLYEKGLITYMRTDSTNLSAIALADAKALVTDNFGAEYSRPRQFRTRSKNAQEAHEAIRPTHMGTAAIEGTSDEQKLYNLIWKRAVASQMADAKVLNTTIKVASDKRPEKFVIQAAQILFDGFLKLYSEGVDDADEGSVAVLPALVPGDELKAGTITSQCKFSQAPWRYSETTLIKKLEELGIGRPSTYAPTVDTLTKTRGYVVKGDKTGEKRQVTNLSLRGGTITETSAAETVGAEKGKLLPTEVGRMVSDYLVEYFPDIMNYDFTAKVEEDFDIIASGKARWQKVIGDFYSPFHSTVEKVRTDGQYSRVERNLGTTPDGQPVIARFGQYGAYVQKGEGGNRTIASLPKGVLIDSLTLEQALSMFTLPRKVGQMDGVDIMATTGRFGPYLKYGSLNISLPKKADPLSVTLQECEDIIRLELSKPRAGSAIVEFEADDIHVLNGRYGPYIKHAGANWRIPRGTDPAKLTLEECRQIIASQSSSTAAAKPARRTFKKRK